MMAITTRPPSTASTSSSRSTRMSVPGSGIVFSWFMAFPHVGRFERPVRMCRAGLPAGSRRGARRTQDQTPVINASSSLITMYATGLSPALPPFTASSSSFRSTRMSGTGSRVTFGLVMAFPHCRRRDGVRWALVAADPRRVHGARPRMARAPRRSGPLLQEQYRRGLVDLLDDDEILVDDAAAATHCVEFVVAQDTRLGCGPGRRFRIAHVNLLSMNTILPAVAAETCRRFHAGLHVILCEPSGSGLRRAT